MNQKTLLLILLITINHITYGQIEFTINNNITVLKNDQELQNPWAGGLNFCQFSQIV